MSDASPSPERVPPFPVVRVETREEANGTWTARVDGRTVSEGTDEETARATVIEHAAERAAQRPQKAIRVVASGFGVETSELVVTAEADVLGTAAPRGRRSRRALLVGGAVAGLMLTSGGALVAVAMTQQRRTDAPVVMAPPPAQLPVLPPAGFSAVASWAVPVQPASLGASAAVTTFGGSVFVVASDGSSVLALDAGSGIKRWQSTFPSTGPAQTTDRITGGPVIVSSGHRQVVMAWSASHVVAMDPATGSQVGVWQVMSGTSQTVAFPSGVVTGGTDTRVQVFTPSGVVDRVVPAGTSVVGLTEDGQGIVTVGSGRVWTVKSSTVAGDGTSLPAPSKGVTLRGGIGVIGSTLLTDWTVTGRQGAWVQATDLTGKRVAWRLQLASDPMATLTAGGALRVSSQQVQAAGRYWIAGSLLVDAQGKAHTLPAGWTTTALNATRAFGTTSQGVGVTSATGQVVQTQVSGATPTAPQAVDESDRVFLVASDGSTTSLYALRPLAGAR